MSVRWGIVGTAQIAAKVERAIKLASNAELVAVASRTQGRADEWAKEHEVERAYGGYEELLGDPEVDAVYIPLPPSMHGEWAIKAARAGKHVLSEKPLTMDLDEALATENACRENKVQLMDGVMWVHHDRTAAIKKLQESGDLGPLRRATASFSFNWGPSVPVENIRAQKELGGGALGDLGYYCVRGILWAFEDRPREVRAWARYANGVDVEMSAILFFPDDRIASFDCGFTMGGRSWLELAGTDASLVVDGFVVPPSEDESYFYTSVSHGVRELHRVGPCIQEVTMIERFSEAVKSGELDPKPPKDAVETVRVCCAVAESADTGKPVAVG